MRILLAICFALLFISETGYSQVCTGLGQTPSTAFSLCNNTSFIHNSIPRCSSKPVNVPGCSDGFVPEDYYDRNPYFYRFICSSAGTLGFLIDPSDDPNNSMEDFDWQVWDITGRNPEDIFLDTTLVIAGNWSGSYGTTGATSGGLPGYVCASEYNRYTQMPTLIEGHEYLLMVSHFTSGEDGYTILFNDGTAVINDSLPAHMMSAKADCDNKVTVKLNKKLRCSTLTATGSEFSLTPGGATIISATSNTCSIGALYTNDVILELSNPLPAGDYELEVKFGDDGNTMLDDCDRALPLAEKAAFRFNTAQPVFADSIGRTDCGPDEVQVYFPKRIDCRTIAADGSDFIVSGPSGVAVVSAAGDCKNNLTDVVTVRFSTPIFVKGQYTVTLTAGTDGNRLNDECDIEMPQQSLPFQTQDAVSADFTYNNKLGCRFNTITFSHDGANDVMSWNWMINNTPVTTQIHSIKVPATSTTDAQLIVSNGTCSDTSNVTVTTDNEVKADFDMPVEICPEDALVAVNISTGVVDNFRWTFGNIGSSVLKDPLPQQFPQNVGEAFYNVNLTVSNNAIGCSDSVTKRLHVLNSCFIAVPSAFSPNGDGLNDFLYPNNAVKALGLEFRVYNRWGQLVFVSRNAQDKWDGRVKGIAQAPGVYVWSLGYNNPTGQKVFQKGTTILIR